MSVEGAAAELERLLSKLESYLKKYSQACGHAVYLQRRMAMAASESLPRYEELRRELDEVMQAKLKFQGKLARLENELGTKFSDLLPPGEAGRELPEQLGLTGSKAQDPGTDRQPPEDADDDDDDEMPELVPVADAPQAAAVAALLREKLNAEIRPIRIDEIKVKRAAVRKRSFYRHIVQVGREPGNTLQVLAKTDAKLPPAHYVWRIESFMGSLQLAEFRSPRFFGAVESEGGHCLAVWEYHWLQRKTKSVAESLEMLARAAAAIASITPNAVKSIPELTRGIDFLKPMADRIRERWLESGEDDAAVDGLPERIDRLEELEDAALKRLAEMESFLCHNDFAAHNVFIPSGGPPIVIDWESATLGPPGACLRIMARRDAAIHQRAADMFADCLSEKGIAVPPDEVLFGMRTVEVFRALRSAARKTSHNAEVRVQNLRWALDHLDYLEVD